MRLRTTTALAALLAAGITPLAIAAPSAAAAAKLSDDFNGDGYRDLVVGAPEATVSGKEYAGAVTVLYGAAAGPGKGKKQLISQATAGVEGAAEANDEFGRSVASADLDADGYADLLVGAPYEDVTGAKNRGGVTVLWGGAQGLKGSAALPTAGPSAGATGCVFGVGLSAVNPKAAAGRAVVSVAGWCATRRLTGPFTRSGKPATNSLEMSTPSADDTLLGDLNGDGRADYVDITVGLSDHPDGGVYVNPVDGSEDEMLPTDGDNATIGDVNGDGFGDLVIGDPADDVIDGTPREGTGHKGGQIAVWLGSAQGITPAGAPLLLHQDTPGVPGAAEPNDSFGSDVSVADVNGDGYGDIAVGVPGEKLGSAREAGSVILVPGGPTGPTGAGSRSISQSSSGVPGTTEHGDRFGSTVRLADLTKDGRPELVVGAPGESAAGRNNEMGGIWVFKGTPSGPTPGSSYSVMGEATGLSAARYNHWSSTLAP
ncbi:FG-GAP-like repeat-containing protein [Streptomyces sp. NPDC058274]|uniref:FG-GAP-like repeat-containing protein n=1 Tax=Streptomyces sp. NPDC058274 TaxID=3346416 RepID=UPI0036E28B5F